MQAGARAGEALTGLDELLGGSEGALAQLRAAARRIERGAADHPLLAEALASLDRALIEAGEAETRISSAADALAFSPERLEAVETRLFDIRGLARKHRVEADALAALGEELEARLAGLEAGSERIGALEAELKDARERFDAAADDLSAARRAAAQRLDAAMAGELPPLKLDSARFRTSLGPADPGPSGVDRVEFEVCPRTVPVREGDEARMGRRLSENLPDDARLTDAHADPGANIIGAVVTLAARSPADALTQLTAAMERLAVNVRREHGHDPLGPMPELRRVTITRAAEA